MTPQPPPLNPRDLLKSRLLPEMTLSDGSAQSMTPPTPGMPEGMSAVERALKRFEVVGNAVVTGGTGTLALVCARALLDHGLTGLCLLDLHPPTPATLTTLSHLRTTYPTATILFKAVDVTSATSVARATQEAADELGGGIDILCCFAGVVSCMHTVDVGADEWRRTLDVNTTGAFLCAQAVAKHMISRKRGGSVVFVASISAHTVNFPQPQAAYNVSKAALLHMARSLAAEWAVHGIRVNSVSPGYMDTILNEGEGLEAARRVWKERNPMGRMGVPEEIAGVVVLLCSRVAGAYVSGADFVVDGGQTVF